mmetsp:Transcript_26544/g.26792  ORF Transcript_26544/g.26792 Transcript_26544/m.26792 type:complete len:124 (-) Transcript_26544:37-408(-)
MMISLAITLCLCLHHKAQGLRVKLGIVPLRTLFRKKGAFLMRNSSNSNTDSEPMSTSVPYGYNWQDSTDSGYFFEDKTRYIIELEKYRFASLYRPPGMGKSSFCQSLKQYYDLKQRKKVRNIK